MIHNEDTRVTNGAMVSPCRLDLITFIASLGPKSFQVFNRFASIPQKSFDIRREAVKSVIFQVLRN